MIKLTGMYYKARGIHEGEWLISQEIWINPRFIIAVSTHAHAGGKHGVVQMYGEPPQNFKETAEEILILMREVA